MTSRFHEGSEKGRRADPEDYDKRKNESDSDRASGLRKKKKRAKTAASLSGDCRRLTTSG